MVASGSEAASRAPVLMDTSKNNRDSKMLMNMTIEDLLNVGEQQGGWSSGWPANKAIRCWTKRCWPGSTDQVINAVGLCDDCYESLRTGE